MGRWASQSLTRRELIRRGAIGGAAVAIAACAPAAVAPSARPSATPKRGGTLTWAQWDKNDDLDPATPTGGASLEILGNVLDTLILMDDDQKAYPLLATEWKSDPDAKRFTFTLRDDVTFHDGSRLDSSAVKRTWDRILDPKTKSTVGIGLFGPVDRIARQRRAGLRRGGTILPAAAVAPIPRHPVAEAARLAEAGRQGRHAYRLGAVPVIQPQRGRRRHAHRQRRLQMGSGAAAQSERALPRFTEVPCCRRTGHTGRDARVRRVPPHR